MRRGCARSPRRQGLRGDPHLWDALRRRSAGRPVPSGGADEVLAVLRHAIAELVGCDLRDAGEAPVSVPAFRTAAGGPTATSTRSPGAVTGCRWSSSAPRR